MTLNNFDMTDPNILNTDAYIHLQNDFETTINEGPTFICNICIKFEYRKNVVHLNETKYSKNMDIFNKCVTQINQLMDKSMFA